MSHPRLIATGRRSLAAAGAAALLTAAMAPAALASPSGAGGPGVCGFAPGQLISPAKNNMRGPNAGPNTAETWIVGAGDPMTPGQAIINICMAK